MEPDKDGFRFIGRPVRRAEDERLVTGKGRFSDDFKLDHQAYAAMVRSPHPHARIRGIDTARARALPGVLGVFTGADCAADQLGPDPARSAAQDQIRHEALRARRRHRLHRPASAAAGRQGAACGRGGRHGGGRDPGAGARRRRGGRGRLRAACRMCCMRRTPWRPAPRKCGTRSPAIFRSRPGSGIARRPTGRSRPPITWSRWTSISAG